MGLSVSLIVLSGALFFFLDLRFSGVLVGLLLFICFVLVIIATLFGKLEFRNKNMIPLVLTVLGVLGLIFWRFLQAETLVFPAWVDSVHHVLITQKILDYGGIPPTLGPELPVPLYYHIGFHSTAALFTWLSRNNFV